MVKPIDALGLGPKREVMKTAVGWRVRVTPPASWSQFDASTIDLTDDQYQRFLHWLHDGGLIQELLPDLSADEREILMTGINPEQWETLRDDDENTP